MENKIFLDNDDVPYEPSESEDELSEEEKEILKEVRQSKQKKTDSKQEILAFDESPDEDEDDDEDADDIIGDSDIERGDENDGIPDSKAWGKQRRSYYNTDFVDQDYSAYNEQEEEQAQQEEEEAKAIQLRLAKQLDEADFFLDLPTTGAASGSDDDEEDAKVKSKSSKKPDQSTKLKSDLSNMSDRQKQQLFKKDSPEFDGLVEDFHSYLAESQNLLTPVIEFADSRDLNLPIIDFVKTRDNMIMTYCTNVAFYLLLKSERISIRNHPIAKRLVTLKKLINQVQEKYEDVVKPQLEDLLERISSGEEIQFDDRVDEKVKVKSKKLLRMMKQFGGEEDGDSGEEYDEQPSSKRAKLSDEEDGGSSDDGDDDDQEEEDGEGEPGSGEEGDAERRGITYQIAKNKGLMPHRKKELRNPRVKHRSKFRKALIRRKGAVRTVRKETKRYGGEVSGIKATTKKGIKIKS